jgi:FtsH-binding integral membrane protein
MDLAAVNPLQLGWAVTGFGVIAWFVWRRRKVGPMTNVVMLGYAGLLGASGAAVAYVVTSLLAVAVVVGLVVGGVALTFLRRE